MRAIVISYDPNKKVGMLRSDELGKLEFDMSQWNGRGRPKIGGEVDFDATSTASGRAEDIYPISRSDQVDFYFPEDEGKQRLTYGILSLALSIGGIMTGVLAIITIPIAVWASRKGLKIQPEIRDGSYVLCQVALVVSVVCSVLLFLIILMIIGFFVYSLSS
ncbi:hypothetical protein SAMN02745824_2394 [Parasphingorhabdus marina DSM 22363]|uniref:DUF4190 domain-containing protein n=1 Tax=Parasphingorhabdus marina DSM 22363 TaxID=1123272 RepID=A0A1N6FHC3_9SPHN|nr:hypothetical protein [Parasphingorhabdus marina]SIN94655.1 hypothetical protein SAMN02745824_2394 [Parasphingorhabdus marina DSM 22363]